MADDLAPVILFVYNRLEHTQHTVEALKKNILAEQSELFIFSDAPKKEEDIEKVNSVREYIRNITGFQKIIIREREKNYGLAKSIVEGVTEVIEQYGKVIVLEDDLITHKYFLQYMNKGLDLYKDDPQVFSITGYSYLRKPLEDLDTYFLKITSSWSWATWKDRWDKYDFVCEGWEILKKDNRLRKRFDYDYSYPFYRLLNMQLRDAKINSWAIKWYWTIFKNAGLTLYPTISLVHNAGFDGSGEHCSSRQVNFQTFESKSENGCLKFENKIDEKTIVRKRIARDLYSNLGMVGRLQIIMDRIG